MQLRRLLHARLASPRPADSTCATAAACLATCPATSTRAAATSTGATATCLATCTCLAASRGILR